MTYKIVFSQRARYERILLIEDIELRFGKKKAQEINKKLTITFIQISKMPEMYRASTHRAGLRKCVFSKQTSIYYKINEDSIEVISLRPNRINPTNFKL